MGGVCIFSCFRARECVLCHFYYTKCVRQNLPVTSSTHTREQARAGLRRRRVGTRVTDRRGWGVPSLVPQPTLSCVAARCGLWRFCAAWLGPRRSASCVVASRRDTRLPCDGNAAGRTLPSAAQLAGPSSRLLRTSMRQILDSSCISYLSQPRLRPWPGPRPSVSMLEAHGERARIVFGCIVARGGVVLDRHRPVQPARE